MIKALIAAVRILLGLLSVLAASAKAIQFNSFVRVVTGLSGLPVSVAAAAAAALVLVEFLLGLMLVLKVRVVRACMLGASMLTGFCLVIIYLEVTGAVAECGCFGTMVMRKTDWTALAENAAAIILFLILVQYHRKEQSL